MKNEGFTLIEIMVIIVILGLLSSGIFMVINPLKQISKARDMQRKEDIKQLQLAIETYRLEKGKYPAVIASGNPNAPHACITSTSVPSLTSEYLRTIPKDPQNGTSCPCYLYTSYTTITDQNVYALFALIEDTSNPILLNKPARQASPVGFGGICAGGIECFVVKDDNYPLGDCNSGTKFNYWVTGN